MTQSPISGTVVALSGGIGGAKLALGFDRILTPGQLTVIANTGDDFEHLGLSISPDIDTLLYTLSDLADPERGWGRRDESWHCMETLRSLGASDWFQLGDRDLAIHLERTHRLRGGQSLSAVTRHLAERLGLRTQVLPMSDQPVATRLHTEDGWLDFQDYFVRRRCEPRVLALNYSGADLAKPGPEVLEALSDPELQAIVVCPSNPWLSIDPILAVPGLREALRDSAAPVVAVSPIIRGQAVKGPTAKLMAELGLSVDAATVAAHYGDLIDVFIVDDSEDDTPWDQAMRVHRAPTLMRTLADKKQLALEALSAANDCPTGA